MCYKHLLHHPHSRWFIISGISIFRNTKNSEALNRLKPIMKKSLTRRSFASGTIFTVVPPFFKSMLWSKKQKADIPIGISATNSTFLDPIRRVLLSISYLCNVRTRHPLLTFALHLANPFPKNYLAVSHHPGSLCRIELRYSFWSSILFIRFSD